jgi:hypothetical protein
MTIRRLFCYMGCLAIRPAVRRICARHAAQPTLPMGMSASASSRHRRSSRCRGRVALWTLIAKPISRPVKLPAIDSSPPLRGLRTSAPSSFQKSIRHPEPQSGSPGNAVTVSRRAMGGPRLPGRAVAVRACPTTRAITEFAEVPEFAGEEFSYDAAETDLPRTPVLKCS